MKTIRNLLIIALITGAPVMAVAQVVDCPWYPAPCPHSEEINTAMDASGRMAENKVTQQEMAMENNLRNMFIDMLQKITRPRHWQMYEIMESDFDRPTSFISYYTWEHTPYEKRPPHFYSITFIVVVNKDSLQAWKEWLQGDFTQHSNQVVADMQADARNYQSSGPSQALQDSVQYYAQLNAKYMQDHFAQYSQDLQSKNEKGIKQYENQVARYQKKSDYFMKQLQNPTGPSQRQTSGGSMKRLEAEKSTKTEEFTNASVMLINFNVNLRQLSFGLTSNYHSVTPQKTLQVPGAFYAGLLHNSGKPDGQSYLIGEFDYVYDHPSNIATVLLGKWADKRTSYNFLQSAYMLNPASTDLTSVKPVKCDVVQSIAIQLEGSPAYIKAILGSIDVSALQKVISTVPGQ
jgi:hypothetical protein